MYKKFINSEKILLFKSNFYGILLLYIELPPKQNNRQHISMDKVFANTKLN